jgi:hypothetical protein
MSFNFKDFSDFKFMITPVFIRIIFWIGAALAIISGLYFMTRGSYFFFQGLITMLIGPIAWRIYCELMIVMFKIHEGVEKMAQK